MACCSQSLRRAATGARGRPKFGHDPRYPVTSNWPHLVQQLADFTQREMSRTRPAGLAGRPFAGRFPEPDVRGRHPSWPAWRCGRGAARLAGAGRLARARAGGWPSAPSWWARCRPASEPQAAQAAGPTRRPRWTTSATTKPLPAGTRRCCATTSNTARTTWPTPQGTRRVLTFDRDVETAIYNTLPHNLDRLLRRHPLRCPVAFVGGTQSQEMKQVGMTMTHKLVGPPRRRAADDRGQPPVPHGAPAGNRRGHRRRALRHAVAGGGALCAVRRTRAGAAQHGPGHAAGQLLPGLPTSASPSTT
jgi:hypothetical protein